jgi:hypothetical protein
VPPAGSEGVVSIIDSLTDEALAAVVRAMPDAEIAKMARAFDRRGQPTPGDPRGQRAMSMARRGGVTPDPKPDGDFSQRLAHAFELSGFPSYRAWAAAAGVGGTTLGVHFSRYRDWKTGKRKTEPDMGRITATALANAAQVDPGWLIGGSGSAR